MDDAYLWSCVRYVELNPVRAGLVERPEEWQWSSARAHLTGQDDKLVRARVLTDRVHYSWAEFLTLPVLKSEVEAMRMAERTGRPLGEKEFVHDLEQRLGRRLEPGKAGRPKKEPKT